MPTYLGSGSSVPTDSSGSLNINVPSTPIKLAAFGLSIPAPDNRVILNATVGISASLGNPTVLFKIYRDTGIIFSTVTELQLSVAQNATVTFQAIDLNVPVGSNYAYSITAELVNSNLLNNALITGPITFSGIATTRF
ncbi:hypothetical protein SAMN04488137_0971 [Fictibacillus solisalsi]|uniref:Exosporium leader peptide n=1 Tax=Fictibacillus solisalsi TaxID=459525 RepID=A0A1G9UK26_9BACL|nr:hypothetical protein [Fictibacillus solisalsi]SDM60217.1 hypothetical protein SAMN04488137_0971 [Fictibacillus solisalsi]